MTQSALNQEYRHSRSLAAWGRVIHQRSKPKPNRIDTQTCFVRLIFSKTETNAAPKGWPLLDRSGLVSVFGKNYGYEPHNRSLTEHVNWLQNEVSSRCASNLSGEVHLHTYPKLLGYVFNPVSFWYFHDAQGICKAVLCEVNNTFGERHFYLLEGPEGAAVNAGLEFRSQKEFHVSPFFPVKGEYSFRFFDAGAGSSGPNPAADGPSRSLASVNYHDDGELQLSTSVSGRLFEPGKKDWAVIFLKHGWFTVGVVLKIHWQAVKLLLKGAKFHSKPQPPSEQLTQADAHL